MFPFPVQTREFADLNGVEDFATLVCAAGRGNAPPITTSLFLMLAGIPTTTATGEAEKIKRSVPQSDWNFCVRFLEKFGVDSKSCAESSGLDWTGNWRVPCTASFP